MPEAQEPITPDQPNISDALQKAAWGLDESSSPDTGNPNTPPIVVEKPEIITPPLVETEEILDPKDWLKRELDVDDINVIKQEREELKALREKAKTPAEIKYANDQSKLFHEALLAGKEDDVYNYLHEKKRLDKLTNPDVNKVSAEEVIKYGIAQKNKNLTQDEVNFIYNKKFSFPSKPAKSDEYSPEEYTGKVSVWENQVKDIEREMIIEAKMAMPELEKLKTQLVFTDIPKPEAPQSNKPQSQEDLAAFEKDKTAFITNAETVLNDFSGFNVPIKDKDVDFSVNYAPSKEEKEFVSTKFKEFANSGFDANALLAQRWVNEDRTLNVNQMTKDLLRIYADDKANQKLANDAANQRLELYIKDKKNINLNNNNGGEFTPDQKTVSQHLQEAVWNN